MTQPEALRLADRLRSGWGQQLRKEAEEELRRLHEENERCREVCKATSECWRADAEKWQAQRDALLAALKYHQEQTRPIQKSIDAIAKAEENT